MEEKKVCLDQVILIATSLHMESYSPWHKTLRCHKGISVSDTGKDSEVGRPKSSVMDLNLFDRERDCNRITEGKK